MPNFDGNGPMGKRCMGRGLGSCGKGMVRGRGYIDLSKDDQKKVLEAEKEQIEKRLKEL